MYNAQQAGAAAVIIADTQPLCLDAPVCNATACDEYCPTTGLVPAAYNPSNCECVLPFMADDPAFEVAIPSVIVTLTAATAIKACLAGSGPGCVVPAGAAFATVVARLVWPLPAPDNHVEWSMWSMPGDPEAQVRLWDACRAATPPLALTRGWWWLGGGRGRLFGVGNHCGVWSVAAAWHAACVAL